MDSTWQSISTGRAQQPLPSIRRCISPRSFAHLGALVVTGQLARLVVERFDLLGDREVLLRDGLVGDAGVDHRHRERLVAKQCGDGVQAHAAVDCVGGLGGQGVPELVSGDVADSCLVADPV
jgi:hypothetical protein